MFHNLTVVEQLRQKKSAQVLERISVIIFYKFN
jgi:hypothetical protein